MQGEEGKRRLAAVCSRQHIILYAFLSFLLASNLPIAFVVRFYIPSQGSTRSQSSVIEAKNEATRAESCQELITNSDWWNSSARLGNSDVDMTDEFLRQMLLSTEQVTDSIPYLSAVPFPFTQTLCYNKGIFPFQFDSDKSSHQKSDGILRHSVVRLLVQTIHNHQHRPALEEAKMRWRCSEGDNNVATSGFPVGRFDYECRGTKYLVLALSRYGLGSSVYSGAVQALLLGLFLNRVVLFVNNDANSAFKPLKTPWGTASCPRADHQCFFLPMSPCVLKSGELRQSTILEMKHLDYLNAHNGSLPPQIEREPILVARSWKLLKNLKPPPGFNGVLMEKAKLVLRQMGFDETEKKSVAAAIGSLAKREIKHWSSWNQTRAPEIVIAAVLYILRPNLPSQAQIKAQLASIFPVDYRQEETIGLPIRGSDKCSTGESSCLSFNRHMDLAVYMDEHGFWGDLQQRNGKKLTIVLSTESAELMAEKDQYDKNESFPFGIITNKQDVLQGAGIAVAYRPNVTADQVMLSTIVAIKMQLATRHMVGDCCSNFHNLIMDLRQGGCGIVASGSSMTCLQQQEDPKFRVCCPSFPGAWGCSNASM